MDKHTRRSFLAATGIGALGTVAGVNAYSAETTPTNKGTYTLTRQVPVEGEYDIIVAGGGDPAKAERLKTVPTWAFHGDADEVVACKNSVKMIDSMKEDGSQEAKLTVLEGAGHGIMHKVYVRPDVYRWMLERRK